MSSSRHSEIKHDPLAEKRDEDIHALAFGSGYAALWTATPTPFWFAALRSFVALSQSRLGSAWTETVPLELPGPLSIRISRCGNGISMC